MGRYLIILPQQEAANYVLPSTARGHGEAGGSFWRSLSLAVWRYAAAEASARPLHLHSAKTESFAVTFELANRWQMFNVVNLEVNHRQEGCKTYADLLNRMRTSNHTDDDIKELKKNVFLLCSVFVFQVCQVIPFQQILSQK